MTSLVSAASIPFLDEAKRDMDDHANDNVIVDLNCVRTVFVLVQINVNCCMYINVNVSSTHLDTVA